MATKILLIGNGFDLANRLPTCYHHFLDFCKHASYIYEEIQTLESKAHYIEKHLNEWEFNHFLRFILINASNSQKTDSKGRITTDDKQLKPGNISSNCSG